jgi:hypothetical protein
MAGFRKAQCMKAALKMGVYGPAGSGKTITALLIAEAIAATTKKRVAFVDTENGSDFYAAEVKERRIHPLPFDFDVLRTRSIAEVNREVQQLKPADYAVVIIDSATHLWEGAIAAYSGPKAGGGQIPMHAWGNIKKPWKLMIEWMLNTPMHVLLCGRLGNKFTEDEDGKTHNAGVKFKAEGETGYEPDFLLQLQPEQLKGGETHYYAYGEKDRTGILRGRRVALWDGDDTPMTAVRDRIVRPLLGLLGKEHAKVATQAETAASDAEEFDRAESEKIAKSKDLRERYEARLRLAETAEQVKEIGAELTKDVKAAMLASDVKVLRAAWKSADERVAGRTTVVPDEPESPADPTDGEAP